MKIGIASAISGIATKKNLAGYGGIERIAADLSSAFQNLGHETVVAGFNGTDAGDVNIQCRNEEELYITQFETDVLFDFSHFKYGQHDNKYSIPMFTDKIGDNPIFPSYAVRYAVGGSGDVIHPGINIPARIDIPKTIDFCFVGRLSRIKGLDLITYLIENTGLKIKINGYLDKFDEEYGQKFVDMAKSMGCIVQCNVPHKELLHTFAESKYFICNPTWHVMFGANAVESFGLTTVEAMSQNTTVLTGNRMSGVREIMGDTGYVMDSLTDWCEFVKNPLPTKDSSERLAYFSAERYANDLYGLVGRKRK